MHHSGNIEIKTEPVSVKSRSSKRVEEIKEIKAESDSDSKDKKPFIRCDPDKAGVLFNSNEQRGETRNNRRSRHRVPGRAPRRRDEPLNNQPDPLQHLRAQYPVPPNISAQTPDAFSGVSEDHDGTNGHLLGFSMHDGLRGYFNVPGPRWHSGGSAAVYLQGKAAGGVADLR